MKLKIKNMEETVNIKNHMQYITSQNNQYVSQLNYWLY